MPNDLIETDEAAEVLGISASTLRSYRYLKSKGATAYESLPDPTRVGRSLLWPRAALEEWQASRPIAGARGE